MGSFVCGNFFGPNLRPPSKASVENAPDHAEGMPGIPGRSICRLKKLLDTFACVVYRIFVWTSHYQKWGDNIVINSNFNNIKRHQDVKVRFFANSLVKQGNTSSKSPHFYANENDETNCTNYTFLCQKKQETNFIANWLRFPPFPFLRSFAVRFLQVEPPFRGTLGELVDEWLNSYQPLLFWNKSS